MRDDIAVVSWAVMNGFTPQRRDAQIKGLFTEHRQGDSIPAGSLSFSLGNHRAWKAARGWRFALLNDGRYTEHSIFFESVQSCLCALLQEEK